MRFFLLILVFCVSSGRAASLAPNTYSLHFDDLCVPENSGTDASASNDTWTNVGSPVYGTTNPAPYEGVYYLVTTSAVTNLTVSAGLRTALENATSWSVEFALFKFARQANSYVWSFDDAGLFLFQVGDATTDTLRLRVNAVECSIDPGDIRSAWHYIFLEGNTAVPYQRIFLDGVGVTGTATAGAGNIGSSTIGRIGSFHSAVGGVSGGIDAFRVCIPACTPPGPTVDPSGSSNRSMPLIKYLRQSL
jgi:hypothetical protein